MTKSVSFNIYRSEHGGLQFSIDEEDADGGGSGTRLAGAKFSGGSTRIMTVPITTTMRDEIRAYLRKVK